MSERWNDLAQRSLMFFYLGLLILLPIAAISVASIQQGLYSLWENITTPQALYALRLTITTAIIMVVLNVVMGTLTAFVLVRYHFPGKMS